MSKRIPQTRPELLQYRREHLDFIVDACRKHDAGDAHYMRQAAVSLRVLLHDTPRSHALLSQLGLLDRMTFLDSAGQLLDQNLATSSNLTFVRMAKDPRGRMVGTYVPVLDDFQHRTRLVHPTTFGTWTEPAAGRLLPYSEWWNQSVARDGSRTDFSRKALVLGMSNWDGGAHVDPEVDVAHHALTRANSLGWSIGDASGETPLENPLPAMIRQIAHEFLRSVPSGWLPQQYVAPVR